MKKPITLLALAASTLALSGCVQTSTAPSPEHATPNRAVVAIGDSLSAASNSCGKQLACYDNSWATGGNKVVDSLAQRLNSDVSKPYAIENYAVLGTKLDGLPDQLKKAIDDHPAYLTLLIGGNDFCTDQVQDMTSVNHFSDSFKKLVQLVAQYSPGTKLVVASTPNPQVIYNAGKANPAAQKAWLSGSICQSMLADPTDDSAAANARRQQVVQRAADFNSALRQNCSGSCIFDQGAVSKLQLTSADISKVDYFHMSVSGQAKIAAAVWENTLAPAAK